MRSVGPRARSRDPTLAGRQRMSNEEHRAALAARRRPLALAMLLAATFPIGGQAPPPDPEPAVVMPWARSAPAAATATTHMVAAANPLAVEAGLEMLRAGGSAADAAIAVQLVLNVV